MEIDDNWMWCYRQANLRRKQFEQGNSSLNKKQEDDAWQDSQLDL